MLRVGLTGGIGCGKTTVAAMMRELGCQVLEADPVAHQVMEPGQPAHDAVIREFGPQVLGSNGRIDRAKLAAIVFSNPARLERLNRIVHPRVANVLDRELAHLEQTHPQSVAVVEAALLVETGYHERLDRLVVVWCEPGQQIERLMARGMTQEQAERRIAAQMPLDQKRRLADDEIDCSGSLEATRLQVVNLVADMQHLAASSRLAPRKEDP